MDAACRLSSIERLVLGVATAAGVGFAAGVLQSATIDSDTVARSLGRLDAVSPGPERAALCSARAVQADAQLYFESMSLADLEATAIDVDAGRDSADPHVGRAE